MADRPKVFIGTPMYGGMCAGFYALSMLETQTVLRSRGIAMRYGFIFNEALITRARNWLVKDFLGSDCSHLLFIDADIRWRAEDIPGLLDADKDIICGLYPAKQINWKQVEAAVKNGVTADNLRAYTAHLVVNVRSRQTGAVPMDRPFEVSAAGTGMMLIKREVFEKLKPHVATYVNNVTNLVDQGSDNTVIHEFFATYIEPETQCLLSEDYYFCDLWRRHGGSIWAAPWMRLGHQGSYIFESGPG